MRQSTLRLRSIKFKDGRGELRVLPDFRAADKRLIERHIAATIEGHGDDFAGFALVIWGGDLGSTCHMGAGPRSTIPGILIPDFARARLLAAKISEWTQDDIFGERR
jgi:hypothetical protein